MALKLARKKTNFIEIIVCYLLDEEGNQIERGHRLRWCGDVDTSWWKKMLKRKEKLEKDEPFRELARLRMEKEKTAALSVSSEVIGDLVEISDQSQESSVEEFNPSTDPKSYKSESKQNTRSNYARRNHGCR